ncbi:MAG: sigma 54-interacting transcriptional regulator [Desulfatiglandales bacterium]|jgi:transcriptional regulator of aromatic amino acid metabolism|nr:sigma 54-interacting transcriptional regulator [Desulfatiglandales bacterium]
MNKKIPHPDPHINCLREISPWVSSGLDLDEPLEHIIETARVSLATNRDIDKEVAEEKFREDLYYRLNVVQIHMPALKQTKEDIPTFAGHFLNIF